MQPAQQLDPGVRAQRLEEAAVHAGKINRPRARHTAHRIRTRRGMPPSYRQNNSSRYTVNGRGGERVPLAQRAFRPDTRATRTGRHFVSNKAIFLDVQAYSVQSQPAFRTASNANSWI